jgi:SPOR domain
LQSKLIIMVRLINNRKYGGFTTGAVGLVMIMGLLGSGCSTLRSLKNIRPQGKKIIEQPTAVPSRLDSLWRSQIHVDTVVLTPRTKESLTIYDEAYKGVREPGHADLGAKASVRGYRVQLASAESREELEPLLTKIEREMQRKAYLEFRGDRYTLRIGDFKDKVTAEAERKRAVSYGYKHAWIVQTGVLPR